MYIYMYMYGVLPVVAVILTVSSHSLQLVVDASHHETEACHVCGGGMCCWPVPVPVVCVQYFRISLRWWVV